MTVRDGRTVAWTDWGEPDRIPLLRVPGTPGCGWSVRVDRTPWEERALHGIWDVDPASVPTSVTWYHAVEDRNCPVDAARRLVSALPQGRLVEWRDAGRLTAYHLGGELLDELLARG